MVFEEAKTNPFLILTIFQIFVLKVKKDWRPNYIFLWVWKVRLYTQRDVTHWFVKYCLKALSVSFTALNNLDVWWPYLEEKGRAGETILIGSDGEPDDNTLSISR